MKIYILPGKTKLKHYMIGRAHANDFQKLVPLKQTDQIKIMSGLLNHTGRHYIEPRKRADRHATKIVK